MEELTARLSKTGGTAYTCVQVKAAVEPDLNLPAAAINAMRREVLDQLTALRGRREEAPLGKYTKPMLDPGQKRTARVDGAGHGDGQVTDKLLKLNPLFLYVPLFLLIRDREFYTRVVRRVRLAAVLPQVIHDAQLGEITRQLDQVYDLGGALCAAG